MWYWEQNSGTRSAANCVIDVVTTFWRPLWSITERTHGNMESIFFLYNKNIFGKMPFYFKFCPFHRHGENQSESENNLGYYIIKKWSNGLSCIFELPWRTSKLYLWTQNVFHDAPRFSSPAWRKILSDKDIIPFFLRRFSIYLSSLVDIDVIICIPFRKHGFNSRGHHLCKKS